MAEKVELILQIRDQMSRELKQIDDRIAKLEKTTNKTDSAIGNFTRSIGNAAAAYISFGTAISQYNLKQSMND